MKRRTSYILIIILIFFILFTATFLSFMYMQFSRPPSVKAQSILEINLSGPVQEMVTPDFFSQVLGFLPELSLYDIWINFKKAEADSRIQSVLLNIGYIQCDWGKIEEIRQIILNFRKSGKKVFAYLKDSIDFDKEYYLAAACDEIIIHPLGTLGINGIGGHIPFFKNTLNKIGIEPEIEHIEEYKTAYNQFTETGFTPHHREMMESIYKSIFSRYVETLAECRGKSKEEMQRLIDKGLFTAEEALKAGLIDKILFTDQLEDQLKEKAEKLHKVEHQTYLKIKPTALGLNRGEKIALIYGIGPIHSGESALNTMGSATLTKWFQKARKDKNIKAVVFRVDSPGGSALASDVIWREVTLTKQEKPVIVSMSDVAGSGGYWVSMAANKIVAHPQTLTGSIGVISGKFNLVELYEKVGITHEKLIFGEKADMFSSFRKLRPEEKSLLREQILWIYEKFLTKVSESRNLSKEEVHKIGRGRVWTGAQAKENGLIDELGGLDKAIKIAKEQAGISDSEEVQLEIFPKKISFWQMLFGNDRTRTNLNLFKGEKEIIKTFSLLWDKKEFAWALMPFWSAPE